MKVLRPLTITDSILTSSTVPENDHAQWNIATTYALNDKVIVLSSHKIYKSLQNANVGNNPLDDIQDDPDNLPQFWVEISATNRFKVFDGLRDSQTVSDAPMTYVLTGNSVIDSLAVLNVDANDVDIIVEFQGEEIYNENFSIVDRTVSNWYEFFFKPFSQNKNIYIDGLPALIGTKITITFNGGGQVKAGIISIGQSIFIGNANYGSQSDIRSFSRTEPNVFGVTKLVKRQPKLITRQRVFASPALTTFLYELREEAESSVSVWTTVDDANNELFNAFIVHGIADRFIINAENPAFTTLELEIREI